MEIVSKSASQTQKIAKSFARELKASDVIALYGDLGAGKSVFVRGLAEGLGIKKRILSPTFVFVRSYPIKRLDRSLTFHHLDLFRGKQPKDFKNIGLDDFFTKEAIVAVEWAEKGKALLPQKRIDVKIEIVDEKTRRITITRT